jgi:hypothetical protein
MENEMLDSEWAVLSDIPLKYEEFSECASAWVPWSPVFESGYAFFDSQFPIVSIQLSSLAFQLRSSSW